MSKKILFKAKKKNFEQISKIDQWVEGYYVEFQPHASVKEYTYGIVPLYASDLYILEIDKTTLCQYTGKKDCNESFIFENDILTNGNGDYYLVYWKSSLSNFTCKCIKSENIVFKYKNWDLWTLLTNENVRVLGNLFDDDDKLSKVFSGRD